MRRFITEYLTAFRLFSRNVKLYFLSAFLVGVSNSIAMVLYNLYLKKLGYGPELLGIITSVTSAAAMALSLPAGLLSDIAGPRRILLLSIAAGVPFTLGRFLAIGRIGLIGFNFMHGASFAFSMVAVGPFLTDNSTPAERTTIFSLSRALDMATGFIGSTIGGVLPGLLGRLFGWGAESALSFRYTLVFGSIILAASLIPILLLRDGHDHRRMEHRAQRAPLSRKSLEAIAWFGGTQLIIGIGAGMFVPFMNTYMGEALLLPSTAIGMWFGVSALTQAVATIVAPLLASRRGKVTMIVGSQALSIPFVLVLAFTNAAWLAIVAFLMRTMLMNMNGGVFTALSMEVVDENARGVMSGVLSFVFELGWVIGPLVGGYLIKLQGYRPIFLVAAVLYSISTALFWVRYRTLESGPAQSAMAQ